MPLTTGLQATVWATEIAGASYRWVNTANAQQVSTDRVFYADNGTYQVTVSKPGYCDASAETTVRRKVRLAITASNNGASKCPGATAELFFNIDTGGTVTGTGLVFTGTGFVFTGTGFTFTPASSWKDAAGNTVTTPGSVGNGVYTVTVSATGYCDGTAQTTVNIPGVNPITSTWTTGVPTCGSGDVVFHADGCNTQTYVWYNAASGGDEIGTGSSYLSNNLTETTTLYVACRNGNCLSGRAGVTATINGYPSAPTGTTPDSRCGSGQVTLGAEGCGDGHYRWYIASAGGSAIANETANTYKPSPTESTTYYVACTNGTCESGRGSVAATIHAIPADPTGTAGHARCGTGIVTLSGGTCSSGTHRWYAAASGGSSLGSSITFQTPSISANTTYYVACNNGSCESGRVAVEGLVVAVPAAPATSPVAYCKDAVAVALTATGENLLWGTTTSPASSVAPTPPTSTLGTTTYYVTQTVAGCVSSAASLPVTIKDDRPAAPSASITGEASQTITINHGQTASFTSGGCPGGSTLSWYADDALISGAGNPYTTPVLTTGTTTTVYTYFARCSQRSTDCQSSERSTTLFVRVLTACPASIVITASSQAVCSGASVNLTVSGCTGGVVTWAHGTNVTGAAITVTPTTTAPTQTITYTATCTKAGCTARTATAEIVVTGPPATPSAYQDGSADRATNLSSCSSPLVLGLRADGCTGTVRWYNAGNTLLYTGNPYVTPYLSSNTTFYARCANTCDESANSNPVTLTFKTPPTVTATNNSGAILPGELLQLSAVATAGAALSWIGPGGWTGSGATPARPAAQPGMNGQYTVTATLDGCSASASTQVSITNPVYIGHLDGIDCEQKLIGGWVADVNHPDRANAVTIKIFAGTQQVDINTFTTNRTRYDIRPGGLGLPLDTQKFNDYGYAYGMPAALQKGQYMVRAYDPNGVELTGSGQTYGTLPPATITYNPASAVCQGTAVNWTANCQSGETVLWRSAAGTTSVLATIGFGAEQPAGTYTYTVQCIKNGCASAERTVTITINPLPEAPAYLWTSANTALQNGNNTTVTVCEGGWITFGRRYWEPANVTAGYTGVWRKVGGSLTWTNSNNGDGTSNPNNDKTINPLAVSDAGQYEYRVTSPQGCMNTGVTTLAITPRPAPPTAHKNGSPEGVITTFSCSAFTADIRATGCGTMPVRWYNSAGTLLHTGVTYQPIVNSPTSFYARCVGVCGESGNSNSFTVNILPQPTITINNAAPGTTNICPGTTVGLTAAGGDTYRWSTNETTPQISAGAGTYSVTATNSANCSSTAVHTVGLLSVASVSLDLTDPLNCTSSAKLTATSSGNAYQFSTPDGTLIPQGTGTVNSRSGLQPEGLYSVTVTFANGCNALASRQVTATKQAPDATITPTGTIGCNASVTLSAAAGLAYRWNTQDITRAIETTVAGTFNLTVTGANGCTATNSSQVSGNANRPTLTFTGNSPICLGQSTDLTAVTNGNLVIWDDGTILLTRRVTPSAAGTKTYSATATGANGCTFVSSIDVTINALPTLVSVSSNSPNGEIVTGGPLTLSATATPNTATLAWKGPKNWTGSGASVTIDPANPTDHTGSYTVTATSNGCSASATTAVSIGSPSTPAPTGITVAPTATATGKYCLGTTVVLTTACTTGAASWTLLNSGGVSTGNTLSNNGSAVGTFKYLAACIANGVQSATLAHSIEIVANPVVTALPATAVLTCTAPTLRLTGTGGTTYRFAKDGVEVQNGTTSFYDVTGAGSYSLVVTNANGCSATAGPTTVSVNKTVPVPTLTASPSTTLTCTRTSLTLTAGGGSGFVFSGPGIVSQDAIAGTAVANASGLYSVNVTGANGCIAANSTNVTANTVAPTISIPAPATLTASVLTVNVVATASVDGNTIIGYRWTLNGTQMATTASFAATQPGTYQVVVTASNGCVSTTSIMVEANTGVPAISFTGTLTICAGQGTQVTASGGTGYLWNTGAITSMISVSPTTTTPYTVTVTGANGATAVATVTVTVNPLPNAGITAAGIAGCTSSVTLSAPVASMYRWSNGAITQTIEVGAGTYSLTVTSAATCTAIGSTLVTGNTNTPTLTMGVSQPINCTQPTATVTAMVGTITTPYRYQFDTNTPVANQTGLTLNWNSLPVGTHTLSVTGANGCTVANSTTVTANTVAPTISIPAPATLTASVLSVNVVANASIAGNTITGYRWTLNGTQMATTASLSATQPGTYQVVVTASNGCVSTTGITVEANTGAPTVTFSGNQVICTGDGTQLTASGGTGYRWNTGAITALISVSPTATTPYTVTVTGANGATAIGTVTVTVNAQPIVSITQAGVLGCNASATLTASGASTYRWNTPPGAGQANSTTPTLVVSATGIYSVTATTNSCTAIATKTVSGGTPPVATISGQTQICAGETTFFTGPAGMSAYSWSVWTSPGVQLTGTAQSLNGLTVGAVYTLQVTDASGCVSAPNSVTLTVVPKSPTPTLSTTMAGLAPNGVSVTLTASGCTGGSVTWNTGDTGTRIVKAATLTATTYSATCQTPNQCVSDAATVSVQTPNPTPPSLRRPSKVIICGPQAVTLTADGCTAATMRIVWPDGQTGSSIVVTPTVTTTYTAACWMGEVRSAPSNSELVTVSSSHALALTGPTIYAENAPLALTATVTPAGNYTYVWSGLTAPTTSTANTLTVVAPPAGSYTLTATASSSTGCTAQATRVLTVTASNAITTLSLSQTAACAGSLLTVPFTSIGAFAGGYNFTVQLSDAGGSFASAITLTGTANASPAQVMLPASLAPGSGYRVRVVSTSPAINGTPGPTTLTIGGSPTISLTPSATALSCSTPTLTLSATGGATGTTYLWNTPPGAGQTGATTPTLSVSVAGTYALTVTSGAGCTATASTSVSNAPDALTVGILNSQTSVCASVSALTLTAQPSTTVGVGYKWNTGATTPTLTVSTSGVYTLTITNGTSCSATASTTVTLGQVPSVTVAVPSATTVGQPLSLTAVVVPQAASALYRWSGPNSFTATDTTPVLSFTSSSTALSGAYTVLVTLPGGCTVTGTGNLTVGTPTTGTTSTSLSVGAITPTTLCAGAVFSVAFTTSGTVSTGTTFQAQFSDATGTFPASATTGAGLSLTGTSSPLNLTIPANALPGSGYRVRVVSSNPQVGTALSPSVLTIGGLSSLTVAVPVATTVVGNPVSLTALVVPQPATAAYAWNGPNSFTALTTSNILSFSVSTTALSGQYTVVTTLPGGCTLSGTGNLTLGTPPSTSLSECDIRIVSKDSQGNETDRIPRILTSLGSLTLSVETLDGTTLTGYTYRWFRTTGVLATATTVSSGTSSTATSATAQPPVTVTLATAPTISATAIGEYSMVLTDPAGNTCVAYTTLSAKPCTEHTAAYTGCKDVTITNPSATNAIANLAPGDEFYAGDYKVRVTTVTGGGPNGWTGEGTVDVTLLKGVGLPVQVTFENAKLNECYELADGKLVTKYDPTWFSQSNGIDSNINSLEEIKGIYDKLIPLLETFKSGDQILLQEIITQLNQQLLLINQDISLSDEQKQHLVNAVQSTLTSITCLVASPTARIANGGNVCSLVDSQNAAKASLEAVIRTESAQCNCSSTTNLPITSTTKEGDKIQCKGEKVTYGFKGEVVVESCFKTWLFFAGFAGSGTKRGWYHIDEYKKISRLLENKIAPIIFIHGTFSNPDAFGAEFKNEVLNAIGPWAVQAGYADAQWSGGNDPLSRESAGTDIAGYLESEFSMKILAKNKSPLHITLISHSHGGNVAKLIKNWLETRENAEWIVDIINIETPQRADVQTLSSYNRGVYLNFWSDQDAVQWFGSFGNLIDYPTPWGLNGPRKEANGHANNIQLFQRPPFYSISPSMLDDYKNFMQWKGQAGGHSLQGDKWYTAQIIAQIRKYAAGLSRPK